MFAVFDRSMDTVAINGSRPDLSQACHDAPGAAALGALGPALFDFATRSIPGQLGGQPTGYGSLWAPLYRAFGDDVNPGQRGLISITERMTELLDKVKVIADDEDLGALADLRSEADDLPQLVNDLQAILDTIPDIAKEVMGVVKTNLRPAAAQATGLQVPPDVIWQPRDRIAWRRTGKFAARLMDDASTPEQTAFATGWWTSYAAHAAASPALNTIVGSTHRLHWYRTRWVANHVDAWAHGSESAAPGSAAVPDNSWENVVEAHLYPRVAPWSAPDLDAQELMRNLTHGDPLPSAYSPDLCDLIANTVANVYPSVAGAEPITAKNINEACCQVWLMLWLQTGGHFTWHLTADLNPPAGGPGEPPDWYTVATSGSGGGGSIAVPPLPQPEISDPNIAEIVCGAILAVFGGIASLFGALVIGAPAIAGGIAMIVDGLPNADWGKLRVDLYWFRKFLADELDLLHQALVLAGTRHPYAIDLNKDNSSLGIGGVSFDFLSGKHLTDARLTEVFPVALWSPGIDWVDDPTVKGPVHVEASGTAAYDRAGPPPMYLWDSGQTPLSPHGVRDPLPFAPGIGVGQPEAPGTAVDCAVDLLENPPDDLPDWNLDADRGLGWPCWHHDTDVVADPVVAVEGS